MILPPDSTFRRDITRPVEFRQPGFDDEFDAATVFYDVIALGSWPSGSLVLVGPPLRNFEASINGGRIGGRPLGPRISHYYRRDRCCDIWLAATIADTVDLSFLFGSTRLRPSRAEPKRYAGRRVLYTLSRDNDPAWIVDWARFHATNHGADAVLLYDNASRRYTPDELLGSLRSALPGIVVDVVSWPFPYGPGGFSSTAGWDSDFCQAGAFQDARFRFLGMAGSVLNCDVDELVVSSAGRSVFLAAEQSPFGCIGFHGEWIAAVPDRVDSKQRRRHADYRYREIDQPERCPVKWCVVPRRIAPQHDWSTHRVRFSAFSDTITEEFGYRHFRAISTDWKYRRSAQTPLTPTKHRIDSVLEAALDRAGLRQGGLVSDAFEDQA